MNHTNLEEIVQSLTLFRGVDKSALSVLLSGSKVKIFKKGSHVFYDKENVLSIYIMLLGRACLYKISTLGEKKIIFVYGEEHLLNEVIFQDLPASVSCEIQEDALLLCIRKNEFLRAMQLDFTLTERVLEALSIKIRRLYRQLKNTSNSVTGDKRIVAKLWKLANDYGIVKPDGVVINMDMSITYLADMVGSKRETVSRQVKMLSQIGLIKVDKNRFMIPDMDLLREYFKKG